MEVAKVLSIKNQSFNGNLKTKEKQTKTPEQIKDSKKKLALALTGMGALAVAGIALYKGKSNAAEKVTNAIASAQKQTEIFEEMADGRVIYKLNGKKLYPSDDLANMILDDNGTLFKINTDEFMKMFEDTPLPQCLRKDMADRAMGNNQPISEEVSTAVRDIYFKIADKLKS